MLDSECRNGCHSRIEASGWLSTAFYREGTASAPDVRAASKTKSSLFYFHSGLPRPIGPQLVLPSPRLARGISSPEPGSLVFWSK